jgi:hypothetical protein
MFDLHLSVEQEKREKQELDRIHNEANLETDMYSEGFFDGLIGEEPSTPERHSYWSGYSIGYREYWANKRGVKIPSEF